METLSHFFKKSFIGFALHLFLWPYGEISPKKTLHIASGEVPQLPWKEKISKQFRRLTCLSDQHP